jgi:GH43 family beta-xylosidase
MGGLDIIMACDFYQANPIWYSWIFKSKINGFNVLMTIFWSKMHYTKMWFLWLQHVATIAQNSHVVVSGFES